MVTRAIRAYVHRDWDAARRAKDEYVARRIEQLGPEEALRLADELRRQALAHVPGWPTPDERALDLETHVRVSALLRRVD